MKVKRKELEQLHDDFSLSSPAWKIRRLDAELPPIVEEEDSGLSMRYEQAMPKSVSLNGFADQLKMPDIEELPRSLPENEEKAIVLFRPINTPISYSGTNYSVDPNLITSFKNQALWGVKHEDVTDGDKEEANACRAVIPWAPSHQPSLKPEVTGSDAMDAEEPETTTMEIEDAGEQSSDYYHLFRHTEGLSSPWQQTHCMFPQPPQSTTTPLVWYR